MQSQKAEGSESIQVSPKRKKLNKKAVIITLVILLAVVGGVVAGYQLGKNSVKVDKDKIATLESQVSTLKDQLKTEASKPTVTTNQESSTVPVAIYEPSGLFNDQERTELQKKLINPLGDYYPNKVASIYIEVNSPQKFVNGNNDYKYLVSVVYKDSTDEAFVYGSKKNGIEWWAPSCFSTCEFTSEYKEKYPEVVKKSGS